MSISRRAALTAIGGAVPFGLRGLAVRASGSCRPTPTLRFRPFEEAVREAFATSVGGEAPAGGPAPVRRLEVGACDLVLAGVQGCHNDRPFAGFPAGHLRIVRTGAEPGPAMGGVRLYASTVDVALTGGQGMDPPSRELDFSTIPPAPRLEGGESDTAFPAGVSSTTTSDR